ncbi:hypothetical protein ACLQ18_35470 [Streptomyces sp. DT193]|uniref:hypothetical protein n=1 Tax=Streptomyces sp. DT193 TaxID=3393418 RepID=UPI003CF8071E
MAEGRAALSLGDEIEGGGFTLTAKPEPLADVFPVESAVDEAPAETFDSLVRSHADPVAESARGHR